LTPRELLDSGKLSNALQTLIVEVRDNPTDLKRRTFLFELLCFSGEYDRAEKHLDVLSQESQAASMGALLYRAALHAERLRHGMFAKKEYPSQSGESSADAPKSGILNDIAFQTFADSDPRIGTRLEVFAAGSYLWIPFEHIESVEMAAPRNNPYRTGFQCTRTGRSLRAGPVAVLLQTCRRDGSPGPDDGLGKQ